MFWKISIQNKSSNFLVKYFPSGFQFFPFRFCCNRTFLCVKLLIKIPAAFSLLIWKITPVNRIREDLAFVFSFITSFSMTSSKQYSGKKLFKIQKKRKRRKKAPSRSHQNHVEERMTSLPEKAMNERGVM